MKDIKGYEGKYAVTTDGKVWSYLSNKFLTPFDKNGYERVELQGKPFLVHRLVAETYIPNIDNKPTVDHIDRNKHNNCVENLRWATFQEQSDNIDFTQITRSKNRNCGFCHEIPVIMCDAITHEPIKEFRSMSEGALYVSEFRRVLFRSSLIRFYLSVPKYVKNRRYGPVA